MSQLENFKKINKIKNLLVQQVDNEKNGEVKKRHTSYQSNGEKNHSKRGLRG